MKTVVVELKDENALRLLKDLELANIIRLVEEDENQKVKERKSVKDLRGSITKTRAKELIGQLNKMREEWKREKNS